ncbi:DNA-directed RNA polymerase subunit 5 [Klosneuvirus KNV1]|uniref:DNA-directed RNA polymerase subunit 5 n=1 Tax=Klosneuvirus KNV1 TaxID=1977640 RepID=A0A1V0SIC8_9VIRU|nr:DNA-directed RNA polymerase subunit 5 [Klosneuvirus KNV1]
MDTIKIFQIEKSDIEIKKTVLTNCIKMLTERKLLNVENLSKNINKITSLGSDDDLYTVELDNPKSESSKKYIIKIFNQKIVSISKQSTIIEFLNKHKNTPKIIIVKDINPKPRQSIVSNFPSTEVFLEQELMINLIDSEIIDTKYEILEKDGDRYKEYFEAYQNKKKQMPRLFIDDPMARYYNLKRYDIVRCIRISDTSGLAPFYRIVV